MKSFWGDYRPPPAGQRQLYFPPPPGTDPNALCRCGHTAQQHLSGACGRCGHTTWDPVDVGAEGVSDPAATILDDPTQDSGHSSNDHEPEKTP